MSEEKVTGERFELYVRLLRSLAYFPVEPWPVGGHRAYYKAALDFCERNGYQRADLVDQLFDQVDEAFIEKYGKKPNVRS